eukprot:14378525-Alexandrium_andersonii.AAC.1
MAARRRPALQGRAVHLDASAPSGALTCLAAAGGEAQGSRAPCASANWIVALVVARRLPPIVLSVAPDLGELERFPHDGRFRHEGRIAHWRGSAVGKIAVRPRPVVFGTRLARAGRAGRRDRRRLRRKG